jgi:putative hydrolase
VENNEVARHLEEVAALLQMQGANPFRVGAYRQAADRLRALHRPLTEIVATEGVSGLERLPGIGGSLARSIEHLAKTGRLPLLDRLRGDSRPERIFTTVADIGPKLARRIHDQLGIESLADLECAAHDGRLAKVSGMGEKRIRAVRESVAGRFPRKGPSPYSPASCDTSPEPPVAELLDVDRQYRRLAQADRLPRIAPRRFNPGRRAWLPILHTRRGRRNYTVLYSNTARAHELGAIRDWVVIFLEGGESQSQWTAITARYGRLRSRRIIRGRESECGEYYEQETAGTPHEKRSQGALFDAGHLTNADAGSALRPTPQ